MVNMDLGRQGKIIKALKQIKVCIVLTVAQGFYVKEKQFQTRGMYQNLTVQPSGLVEEPKEQTQISDRKTMFNGNQHEGGDE